MASRKSQSVKTNPDTGPMVLVKDLVRAYNHDRKAVIDHLSLRVDKGEMVILMGKSGCGKTTLLNLIAGLDRATSGSITVDGTVLDEMSEDELARFRLENVGFVFQDYNLISNLTILENVSLPLKLAGKKNLSDALDLLQVFDIAELANEKANTVSGGEAQRTAIARAIANKPKILLADEPTGNLDEENEINVMNYFSKIRQKFGMTIIIATHNKSLSSLGDRIITIGEVASDSQQTKTAQ